MKNISPSCYPPASANLVIQPSPTGDYNQNDLQSKKSILTSTKPTSSQQQGAKHFPCCHALSQQWLDLVSQNHTKRQNKVMSMLHSPCMYSVTTVMKPLVESSET
jgi:hypothetical protein